MDRQDKALEIVAAVIHDGLEIIHDKQHLPIPRHLTSADRKDSAKATAMLALYALEAECFSLKTNWLKLYWQRFKAYVERFGK